LHIAQNVEYKKYINPIQDVVIFKYLNINILIDDFASIIAKEEYSYLTILRCCYWRLEGICQKSD